MRRSLSSWVFAAIVAAPVALLACGDDDDTPRGSAGRAGATNEGGDDSGGKGGKASGGGGNDGRGGRVGSEGGQAGETPGGQGGEPSGRPSGGTGDGGTSGGGMPGEGGSGGLVPPECDLSGVGKEREELPNEIEEDLTLEADKVYVIRGTVKVREGATLTIPACTRLEGLPDPTPGFIAVLRGGRIVADGTADAPILFTSSREPGDRAAGDWGGVVLLGRAPITYSGGAQEAIYEGLTEADYTYGGNDEDDDSGVLRYVRIEYSGWDIFPEKEVNGLSMAGVGRGTVIDHVMVSNTKDDCFEWWGGTVEANYLIANNCGDDYFDGDEGWQGGGKYWFGRRDFGSIDSDDPNGFEFDSINSGVEPRTAFRVQHVTLCGPGEASDRPNPLFGMVLRELVTGQIDDLALLGFEYGIDTRNAFVTGDVTIENSKFWELVSALGAPDTTDNDEGFDDASIFTDDDSNELDPDPVPFTVEQCLEDNGPDAAVLGSEIGAFPDADAVAEWKLDGAWVDWLEE